MDIPIELFLGFIGVSIALAILGFLRNPQIPATIVMGGMFILVIAVATDNIKIGNFISNEMTTTSESFIVYMQQNLGTTPVIMNSVNNIFVGEEIVNSNSTLYLKSFDEVTIAVTKQNSPIGTAIVGVWGTQVAPTSTNYVYTLGTFDVSTLANSITVKTFRNNTNPYTLLDNQAVGVFYNGASGTNTISIITTSSNQFDGANSQTTRFTSSWTDVTTDLRMNIRLSSIDEESIITNESINYEFTELPKTLFALIGVMIMLVGGLMVMRE